MITITHRTIAYLLSFSFQILELIIAFLKSDMQLIGRTSSPAKNTNRDLKWDTQPKIVFIQLKDEFINVFPNLMILTGFFYSVH